MNASDVEAGYRACETDTQRWARNFSLGIRLLPRARRRALSAVYWFSQSADRAVDGDGSLDARRGRLDELRAALDRMPDIANQDPRWLALADATERYSIPKQRYHELLDGVGTDLEPRRYEDWPATLDYCHGVASVVGLISLRVFGGSGPECERSAVELGYALQLTNILRDLREDAARDRWYLPLDETARFGVTPAAVSRSQAEPGFEPLVMAVCERARGYYRTGAGLYPRLPRSTRACPAALVGVYRGLLERIASDPIRALGTTTNLGPASKVVWGLGQAARAMLD